MPSSRSRSALLPVGLAAACLCAGRVFVAPRPPSLRPQGGRALTARQGAANSVPTGLVYPSPEEAAKTREVDGIKLYSTHAWTDDMVPILEAKSKPAQAPVMIGVAADSGCGKSTFLRRVLGALGTELSYSKWLTVMYHRTSGNEQTAIGHMICKPRHTPIGDMLTVICLDDYHINDRAGRKATSLSALDARENDFALMGAQIEALKQGKAIYKPIYNHDTGNKDPPELIQPNKVFVVEGLHPIYDEKARANLDMALYIDIVNDVKFAWKIQRDVAERGWTEDQVREDIEKRLPDFAQYVDPQKKDADVVLRYEPSDQGLPYLKVKLIQKKGGAFPAISLKKEMTLTGSTPGATLKQYDDDWYGSPVSVIEMDGEIDMDNMAEQVAEIEANLEGLNGRSPSELTDAMVKLKDSPGSQNGTGLLQAIIAMKIREVYDKLTQLTPA